MPLSRTLVPLLLACAACGGRTDLSPDTPASGADASLVDVASSTTDVRDAGASSPPDASAVGAPDATPDVYISPAIAPCMVDTRVIYLRGDPGSGFFEGEGSVVGSQGTWSADLETESIATVETVLGGPRDAWEVILAGPITGGVLVPGDYDASFPGRTTAAITLYTDTGSCGGAWGSFDLLELEATNGDQALITRILASFDVNCEGANPGAMVHGCVRYEQ